MLANPIQSNNFILSILDDRRQLASQFSQIHFSHCYIEANRCVDFMARKGTQQSKDFCLFDSLPVGIVELIEFDNSSLYLNGIVLLTLYLFFSFYVTTLSTKKKRQHKHICQVFYFIMIVHFFLNATLQNVYNMHIINSISYF